MKVQMITGKDLPEPGALLKFRIKNTTKWRPGYAEAEGTDFIEVVSGVIFRYSWNQIDEYILTPVQEAEV